MHSDESIFDILNRWDAGWYTSIIRDGYMLEPSEHENGDAANWAFFPLYPLLVKGVVAATALSINQAGVILSTLLFFATLIVVHHYISMTRDRESANTVILLLGFGPYSFYYSSLYTESLFILLVALGFYCLEKEKWTLAGAVGALLSMTRITGVMFSIVFFIKCLIVHLREGKTLKSFLPAFLKNEKQLFSLLLIPVGLFAYMTYLYFHVGDPFAFKNIQIAWGRDNTNPLIRLYEGLTSDRSSAYLAIWGILGIAGAVYLFIKKRYTEAFFGFVCITIPIMSNLQSLPRYFMGSLILALAVNDWICRIKPFPKTVLLITIAILNIPLLLLWFAGHPLVT
ncbi:hypothetical protein PCURB6_30580 [Paenibacillus curdlanolyticus]|nr:hypothetical protein PCURB6_30580 [Paenibacillus curdlanolyticus]